MTDIKVDTSISGWQSERDGEREKEDTTAKRQMPNMVHTTEKSNYLQNKLPFENKNYPYLTLRGY